MAKFILIGGGDVGRGSTPYQTGQIDQEAVRLTKKEHPQFLFIGLASNFSDSYYDTMKKIYQNLGCDCAYLKKKNIINNTNIVEEKIKKADIIYFCGGDTIKLKENILSFQLLPLLEEAIKKNVVIVGMSAGAILFCKEGFSDSLKLREEQEGYQFLDGLGNVPISICPHYEKESTRKKELKEHLKNTDKQVLALENGVAIKIINQELEIISSIPNKNAYLVYYDENGSFQEQEIIEHKKISIDQYTTHNK